MNFRSAIRFILFRTRWIRRVAFAIGSCICFCWPLCISAQPKTQASNAVFFNDADFYKPVELDADSLQFKLAPLLLQQLSRNSNSPALALIRVSALDTTPSNAPATNFVYVQSEVFELHGKSHLAFTYLWFYSTDPRLRRQGGLPVQGVRLFLNSAGEPVLWEVLADPSGSARFFVARSLEESARAEFGPALPGRHFAIERGTDAAPKAVVARVIEDGPIPMGPIVYLQGKTQAVATLICRCMPAQAKAVRQNINYHLLPWPGESAPEVLRLQKRLQSHHLTNFWPGDKSIGSRLGMLLRLPSSF